jgi:hypothetical protein
MRSSRESHGDQELSRVNEVELSPRDKVPPAFVPQPSDPGTPPETPVIPNPPPAGVSYHQRANGRVQLSHNERLRKADDATSIVIPSDEPERGTSPDLAAVNQLRREPIVPHARTISTSTTSLSNPNKMNRYEIAELKVVHNEHLRQKPRRDDTTIAQRGTTGTRSIRKLIPGPERGDTP